MSNPVATIGNTINGPADPQVVRKQFTRIVYDQQDFFTYAFGEYDPTYTVFDPTDLGERFFIFVPLVDALDGNTPVKPEFVTQESWDNNGGPEGGPVGNSASGFVTAVNSVMPKLIVPSEILVDNGFNSSGASTSKFWAEVQKGAKKGKDLFNWTMTDINGSPLTPADFYNFVQVGAFWGSQYMTIKQKDDEVNANTTTVELANPADPPTGDWLASDSSDLVVGGAFILMLNVVPQRPATAPVEDVQENPWSITMEFGEVILDLAETGALKATIGGEENTLTANLSEGKTKEGPPQQQHIDDKSPFIILVYPVWNGIVIQSGVQDSIANVKPASVYVPKLKSPSILNPPYSNGFDPSAPAEVEVDVGSGATLVTVDFGSTLTLTAKNCRYDLSYQPVFFSNECWFDEFFVGSDDIGGTVSYAYSVYPIWTANGTAALLDPTPTITQSTFSGSLPDTSYYYIQWRLSNTAHSRHAGEIFGSIIEVAETREFPIKNGNGSFNLNWTGGTPADPSPTGDWVDYIQSISVSITVDGSSGQIEVDKFGVAGQDAIATQSIGAITISCTGAEGTVGGSIFQGLAEGISENKSSDGATWTIPLMGLEKKLDDIALINVPFFDGEALSTTFDFMTRYAGIIDDQSGSPSAGSIQLSVSQDVNVARFDWKSGTSVRSALDDIMADTQQNFTVWDGRIYLWNLGTNGLPTSLGPDQSVNYPDTKVVLEDQTPDFDDVRNEIVVIALQAISDGKGTQQEDIPTVPRFETRQTTTTPDIPWAKSMVQPLPGFLTQAELSDIADRLQNASKAYTIVGRTTIAGNADIRPYDKWGDFIIYSVTHNIDFQAKSWTTDLEFRSTTS
jgi:hypothetical protein